MKNTVDEVENATVSIADRMDQAEEVIWELEAGTFEFISSENRDKRIEKSEEAPAMIFAIASKETTCEFLESQEKREGDRKLLFHEIMAENVPDLGRASDIHVHEAHRSPSRSTERELL